MKLTPLQMSEAFGWLLDNKEQYEITEESLQIWLSEYVEQYKNGDKPIYTGTGSDYLDCVLGIGGFDNYGPIKGVKGLTDE